MTQTAMASNSSNLARLSNFECEPSEELQDGPIIQATLGGRTVYYTGKLGNEKWSKNAKDAKVFSYAEELVCKGLVAHGKKLDSDMPFQRTATITMKSEALARSAHA